ncbi:MAG: AAA family ATPase [Candidatus Shikimatogenerans sp. Tder]|uniref:AAA family ATPase n=1 Tax=Candidatus Shikimatogenerans sp. Tder TaxID=3158566 RepID=A0AAU7QRE4_9FLAO
MKPLNIKYRPKKFKDIIGQKYTIKIIKNMLKNKILNNTILLHGYYGSGKTTCARIISKYINKKIKNKIIINNNIIEINASINNSIEDVKKINKNILIESEGKKIFIIDEVHMFSKSAFNGFLKILEEPPYNVLFILITTKYNKIPTTILSRCNSFYFQKINKIDIYKYIKKISKLEKINITSKALKIISKYSNGSLRDALIFINKYIHTSIKINSKLIKKNFLIINNNKIKKIFYYINQLNIKKTLKYYNYIINKYYSYKNFLYYIYKYVKKKIIKIKYKIFNKNILLYIIKLLYKFNIILTKNNSKYIIELFLIKIILYIKKHKKIN